jgi:hypothetical protein
MGGGRFGTGQSSQASGSSGFSTSSDDRGRPGASAGTGASGSAGSGSGGGGGGGSEQGGNGGRGGGQFAGRGPRGYRRGDDRIGEEICELLTIDSDIDASDIDIIVTDGVVALVGVVDDRPAKRRAEDAALGVSGVRDVQNQLRIDNGSDAQRSGNGGRSADASRGGAQAGGGGARSDDRGSNAGQTAAASAGR